MSSDRGDVWVLAGQSNMEGCGLLEGFEEPSPNVFSFGMDERWQVATEPLHVLAHSLDPVHNPLSPEERALALARGTDGMAAGAGLGLSFGKFLSAALEQPVSLLPCAHGGTSLDQWSPALRHRGGESLYGSMMRRIEAAGAKVTGLLWYQGESDALGCGSGEYQSKWRAWVHAVRRDLGAPSLPVLWAQLSKVVRPEPWPGWNDVQRVQVEMDIPFTAVASTIDLPMVDEIHLSTEGLRRLGRRFAKLALPLAYGVGAYAAGPRLSSVTVSEDRKEAELSFHSVNGSLLSDDPAPGFSLTDAQGRLLPIEPRAVPNGSTVRLILSTPAPSGAALWYGHGMWPECTLTDEEDMGCLAFGPVPLK